MGLAVCCAMGLAAKGYNNPIDFIGYKNHSDFIGI